MRNPTSFKETQDISQDGLLERAWDQYYTGDASQSIDKQTGTPLYDAVYPRPLARHVEIMYKMAKESIDAAAARGDKKAYFFEDGCGSGRYRVVAQMAAKYAKAKGYDIHIIWIGNDISQNGLDLYKNKLLSKEEGFHEGSGYEPFILESKAPCVTKDNLTYKFIKSTEKTTAQELEKKIGVIVENSFDVFGIDGYRLDKVQRQEMIDMRGCISRNGIFLTVPGPAYKRTLTHFEPGQFDKLSTTSLCGSPNTVAILHVGDITYQRGNLTIPFHTFSEDELKVTLAGANLKGQIFISNTRQEKDGLISSREIDKQDEIITAQANKCEDPVVRALHAVYWGVVAKSTLAKDLKTGRVLKAEELLPQTSYRDTAANQALRGNSKL